MNLSVVIISKNEAHNIERCIRSCLALKAEIIVWDSASTDATPRLARILGAKVIDGDWQGYGATKNNAAMAASNDWILSLDADEALDNELALTIQQLKYESTPMVGFWLARVFIFQGKKLRFGALRNEKRLRLYNRNYMKWNLNDVHETLVNIDPDLDLKIGSLKGHILHYSYTDHADMKQRLDKYARLGGQQFAGHNITKLRLKKYLSPVFSFAKNYIMLLGFLDGKAGYLFACEHARYIFKKYTYALERG